MTDEFDAASAVNLSHSIKLAKKLTTDQLKEEIRKLCKQERAERETWEKFQAEVHPKLSAFCDELRLREGKAANEFIRETIRETRGEKALRHLGGEE